MPLTSDRNDRIKTIKRNVQLPIQKNENSKLHHIPKFKLKNKNVYFQDNSKLTEYKPKELNFANNITTIFNQKDFSLTQNLLKSHFILKNTDLLPSTSMSKSNTDCDNQSMVVFITLLKNKIIHVYNEHKIKLELNILQSGESIKDFIHKHELYHECESSAEEMVKSLVKTGANLVQWIISFSKSTPGLNKFRKNDLAKIVDDGIYLLLHIQFFDFFYDQECYFLLHDKKRYSKKWMNLISGPGSFDVHYKFATEFKSFFLTNDEIALLYPYILCSSGNT